MKSMKTGVKILISLVIFAAVAASAYTILDKYAYNDLNRWLCKAQTKIGISTDMHMHGTDEDGKEFKCIT